MMGSDIGLLGIRYLKPLTSIVDEWMIKLPLSFILVGISLLVELFDTHLELVALLILAMIFDLIVGLMASYRHNIKITSLGLRQFGVKVIEYTGICLIATGIGNAIGSADFSGWAIVFNQLQFIDYAAYFMLILTELKSSRENLSFGGSIIDEFLEYVNKFKK